jgi:hypothetical protein
VQWGLGEGILRRLERLAGRLAQVGIGEPIDSTKQNRMPQGEMGVWSCAGHVTCLVLRRKGGPNGKCSRCERCVAVRVAAGLDTADGSLAGGGEDGDALSSLRTAGREQRRARVQAAEAHTHDCWIGQLRSAAALCEAGRRELQGRTATARGATAASVQRWQTLAGAGQGQMQHLKARRGSVLLRRMWAREERPCQRRRRDQKSWRTRGGEAEQMADSGWTLAWLWNALLIAAREPARSWC